MGGGRDFAGQRIYSVKTVNGKRIYTRIRPYKIKQYHGDVETELMDAWDGYGSEEKILGKLGLTGKTSFSDKVSGQTRSELLIGVAKMAAKYGSDVLDDVEYGDTNPRFGFDKPGFENTYAYAYSSGDSGTINLNPQKFNEKNDRARNRSYDQGVSTMFHPKGQDDGMTVMHEYAHLIQRKLVKFATTNINDEINAFDKATKDFMSIKTQVFDGTLKGDARRNAIIKMTEYRRSNPNIDKDASRLSQLIEMKNAHPATRDQEYQIMKLFQKTGTNNPADVARKLTGSPTAYASKDWSEAHAECVADYMRNGKDAKPISIAYVSEMDKLLGIKS